MKIRVEIVMVTPSGKYLKDNNKNPHKYLSDEESLDDIIDNILETYLPYYSGWYSNYVSLYGVENHRNSSELILKYQLLISDETLPKHGAIV